MHSKNCKENFYSTFIYLIDFLITSDSHFHEKFSKDLLAFLASELLSKLNCWSMSRIKFEKLTKICGFESFKKLSDKFGLFNLYETFFFLFTIL